MSLSQNAINLLNQTRWQHLAEVSDEDLVDPTTLVRPIYRNDSAVAYYIAPRPQLGDIDQAKLLDQLKTCFSLQEVRELAFKLGLDHDKFAQTNRDEMVYELLLYLKRRKQLPQLLQLVKEERPDENWGGLPERYEPTPTLTRLNLAVIVSISQLAFEGVTTYLRQQNIEANYLLITNAPAYDQKKDLTIESETEAIAHAFSTSLEKLRYLPKRHYFFACPTAVAFALGCAIGTVREGDFVYHFQKGTYCYAATISRALRGG